MSEFEKELTNKVSPHDRTHNDNELFLGGVLAEHFKDWKPPKPLVVVPQFVSDWFDINQDDIDVNIKALTRNIDRKLKIEWSEMDRWFMYSPNKPIETLISMKLDGYTVEKESKFSLVNKITGEYLVLPAIEYRIKNENIFDHSTHRKKDDLPEWKPEMYQFTEVEITSMETGSYEQIEVEP